MLITISHAAQKAPPDQCRENPTDSSIGMRGSFVLFDVHRKLGLVAEILGYLVGFAFVLRLHLGLGFIRAGDGLLLAISSVK